MNWESRGVLLTCSGVVTAAEIQAVNQAFYSDARSDRARYQIADMRAAEALEVDLKEAETIAAFDVGQSVSTPALRMAMIVPDDRFDAQIRAYLSVLDAGTWQGRIFHDLEEGRSWAESRG